MSINQSFGYDEKCHICYSSAIDFNKDLKDT